MDDRCGILIIWEKWQPYLFLLQCVSYGDVASVTAGFELSNDTARPQHELMIIENVFENPICKMMTILL